MKAISILLIGRKATEISTRFCALGQVKSLHPNVSSSQGVCGHNADRICLENLTPNIAGSSGTFGFCGSGSFGVSSILKSLTSLPRKTI